MCIIFSIKHIPHLSFSIQAMLLFSQFIIRVHLNRQITISIYDFQQQRKLRPILFINPITNQITHIHLYKISQSITLQPTIYHLTIIILHSRNIPTLTYLTQFRLIMSIYILYLISPPKLLLQNRSKLQRIQFIQFKIHNS